jgi:hypothetical protein
MSSGQAVVAQSCVVQKCDLPISTGFASVYKVIPKVTKARFPGGKPVDKHTEAHIAIDWRGP